MYVKEFVNKGISNNLLLIIIKDTISDDRILREYEDFKVLFKPNGEILIVNCGIKTKFIKKIEKVSGLKDNLIVMDIETYIKDSLFSPYAIGMYDGKDLKTNYLTDLNNHEEMILDIFNYILNRPKYNGYFHNLQGFDGIFTLQLLEKYFEINSRFKEGKK